MTTTMIDLRIRRIVAADVDAVIAFWREVFPEYNDPARPQRDPRASIERKLAFGDGLFWLAQDEAGALLGTAMAGYDGHRGWLYSIGVHPARRGRGIGRALLAHAEGALTACGCPKVNLQVLAANEPGLAFWRAVGYQRDEVVSFGRRLG